MPFGYETATHTESAVATSTTLVVAANPDRRYLLLVNDSDTDIYVRFGEAAVLNEGIRINSGGASYEMNRDLGNLYTGVVNGIHGGAATKNMLVTEGI